MKKSEHVTIRNAYWIELIRVSLNALELYDEPSMQTRRLMQLDLSKLDSHNYRKIRIEDG